MSARLAINSSVEKTDPPDSQQSLPESSNLRVLGELHVRNQTIDGQLGRIRFQCEALRDELELSRVLCQELVRVPGIKTARVNTWCAALIIDFDTNILSREQLISHLGQISLACRDIQAGESGMIVRPRILQSIYDFLAPVFNFLEKIFPATINLLISQCGLNLFSPRSTNYNHQASAIYFCHTDGSASR